MTARPHVFTRAELTLLDAYPRISAEEIADQVGVTKQTVYNWMIALGIRRTKNKHVSHHKARPDAGHCTRCGILLVAASRMDGHGWDGMCRYCVSVADGHPMRWQVLPGGDAPELKVFEMFGMAAGKDER